MVLLSFRAFRSFRSSLCERHGSTASRMRSMVLESELASLRWHDPDQVRRSELGEAPSQPGITGLPCFLPSGYSPSDLRPRAPGSNAWDLSRLGQFRLRARGNSSRT